MGILTSRDIWQRHNAGAPTSVYGIYDGGELVYVGLARDVGARWSQHRGDKPWWRDDFVVCSTLFPTRVAALAEESRLIGLRRPRYNSLLPGLRREVKY